MNFARRLMGALGLASVLLCFTAHGMELPTSTPAVEGLSEEKLQKVHEIMNGLVGENKRMGLSSNGVSVVHYAFEKSVFKRTVIDPS